MTTTRGSRRRRWAHLATAAALSVAIDARAQSANDKAAAESLFDDARRLMGEGKFIEACPKLEASQRIDPAPGTLLNLADCYEKSGRTASAWANFRDVEGAAKQAGDARREQIARARAAALEPKLARLTILITPAVAELAGVRVTRDGALVDRALWGAPVPVDAGSHAIEVTATGKRPWSTAITLSDARAASVDGPASLADAPPPPVGPSTAAVAGVQVEKAPAAAEPTGLGAQRAAALGAGGVGAAGLVVGSVFGLMSKSRWDDAKVHCVGTRCDAEGVSLSDRAHSAATLSTVGFAVGLAGIGAGAALWFTAPRAGATASASRWSLSPQLAGRGAGVTFRGEL